jgi:hypothetical protein
MAELESGVQLGSAMTPGQGNGGSVNGTETETSDKRQITIYQRIGVYDNHSALGEDAKQKQEARRKQMEEHNKLPPGSQPAGTGPLSRQARYRSLACPESFEAAYSRPSSS